MLYSVVIPLAPGVAFSILQTQTSPASLNTYWEANNFILFWFALCLLLLNFKIQSVLIAAFADMVRLKR